MSADPAPRALEARGLSRSFGPRKAVDRVSIEVLRGETVALFGPNGAGKTTLLRLFALALRPAEGTLRVDGLDPDAEDRTIRARIGLISHRTYVYDELTARENLEFFARLYAVPRPRERAEALLEQIELGDRADDRAGTFSRGMLQRLSLARALVHDPPILLLDEPFTGLDPHAAQLLGDWLATLRVRGRTVVLVTHDATEGLRLSDRWILMSRGRVVDGDRSSAEALDRLNPERFGRAAAGGIPADR